MRVFEIDGVPAYQERITATTSSIGFTSSKIAPTTGNFAGCRAKKVLVTVETADIRFTLDGTTPVVTGASSTGHLQAYNGGFVISGEQAIANFRCINAVGSSGSVVDATYFL